MLKELFECFENMLKECIKHCIDKEYWPKDSNIIILCGHHTFCDGKLGGDWGACWGGIT